MSQVNPYNILSFFDYRPAFSEPAPLVCGAGLLSFQVNKTTISAVTSFSLFGEDGSETSMDTSLIETTCTSSFGYFATYKATNYPNVPDGKYQFKLVLDSTTYYSWPFCVDSRFNNLFEAITDYSIAQDAPDVYTITIALDAAMQHGRRTMEIDLGDGYVNRSVWVSAGQSKLTITDADGTGTVTATVRISRTVDGASIVEVYNLSFDSADVAGTIAWTLDSTTYNTPESDYHLLTFRNANDITDMRLLYQTGYTQKFWLRGYKRAPQPVKEDRFQTNAKGTPYFNSQTIAERIIMDFAPVPDYLQTVLNALQNHSAITMYDARTGQAESLATARPQFEFTPVEGDVILKGTLSYETNRAFVACEENMEVCS